METDLALAWFLYCPDPECPIFSPSSPCPSFSSFGCLLDPVCLFSSENPCKCLCLHQLFSSLPQEFPYLSSVLCSSHIPCLTGLFLGLPLCCSLLLLFSSGSSLYPVLCCSPFWGHTGQITHLSEGITKFFYTNHVCSLC